MEDPASVDPLALLKFARKQAAAAAKPTAFEGFSKSLRGISQQAKRIRAQAETGTIPAGTAKKILVKLEKSHRQVTKLRTATQAQSKKALQLLDRELARAKGGPRR